MSSRYEVDEDTGAITAGFEGLVPDDDPTRRARVLIALDVTAAQAADIPDLLASVYSRLCDEAGYLDTGDPVMPIALALTMVGDTGPLDAATLRGVYEVGIEGAPE